MDDERPRDEEENEQEELYELHDQEETEEHPQRLNADSFLDKVIPDEIDWRDLVRRHPILSVSLAAGVGFLVGRSKGAAIIAGASAAVSTAIMRQLSDVLDGEVFEF